MANIRDGGMSLVPAVDADSLARLGPLIEAGLQRVADSGSVTIPHALRQLFSQHFGAGLSRRDELRFLMYAAPIARRIAILRASGGSYVGDVRERLHWLDVFDPLCARMIDLHYFAGLTAAETALALQLPAQVVVRELRFAKAWLKSKL